jgi:hypothetical protein
MSTHQIQTQMSDASWYIADPGDAGAIIASKSGYVPIVTAGVESRTVAAPTKGGIDLTLEMKTDGGDCTVTFATSFAEVTDTTIIFTDAGQMARFYSIEVGTAFMWRRYAADPTEAMTITTLAATSANITTLTSGPVATATAGITVTDDTGGSGTAGYNCAAPAAAAVTQQTNINTAVEINSAAGKIQTVSSNLAAAGHEEFTLTNASISNGDIVLCTTDTSGNGSPLAWATKTANGSCVIALENRHGSAAFSAAIVISFIVHKVTISA